MLEWADCKGVRWAVAVVLEGDGLSPPTGSGDLDRERAAVSCGSC